MTKLEQNLFVISPYGAGFAALKSTMKIELLAWRDSMPLDKFETLLRADNVVTIGCLRGCSRCFSVIWERQQFDQHESRVSRIKSEHFPGTFCKCTSSCWARLRPKRSTCRRKLCRGRLLSAGHLYSRKAARPRSLLSFLKCSIRVKSSSQILFRIASFLHPKISPISARIPDFLAKAPPRKNVDAWPVREIERFGDNRVAFGALIFCDVKWL